jgi:superfamily II DNA/RNA helicase
LHSAARSAEMSIMEEQIGRDWARRLKSKLNITSLNDMQSESFAAVESGRDVLLFSPTGTGKTLAFLLPLMRLLDPNSQEIQLIILVPSRELAQQIEQVARELGTGFKVNSVYGGRSGMQDRLDLKHRPAILIGTPGRVADRFRRDELNLDEVRYLALDEFDKSLEIGFEREMKQIVGSLPNVAQRILTSATGTTSVPEFVGVIDPEVVDYSSERTEGLKVRAVEASTKDRLATLKTVLLGLQGKPGVIFCNFKNTLFEVSDFLSDEHIIHGAFYGGMEQLDRDRSLITFRNGTHQLLLATDLAARGLDIPEIAFIIHFEIPIHLEEFTHRNGRTARMHREGEAIVLQHKDQRLPQYYRDMKLDLETVAEEASMRVVKPKFATLYISGGRRDKISKGDIAGLLFKQGELAKEEVGVIELQQNCAYVGVARAKAYEVAERITDTKLKKKKVRISVL